ncbi:MAG TPA: glycosyltransferase family 2 protein, partial [Deltaproteobacteria bacterium]|nr:glycosyltransferase family 2 protein [Deltaproteobacteria bacterium]
MDYKKVSVVIPLFNSAPFIHQTLISVFKSSYPDYEVILVDDGSVDETSQILENYGWMKRVTYIHQKNKGISAARNKGILAANGYYVSLLDHDDHPLPDKLTKLVDYLEKHPQYKMV